MNKIMKPCLIMIFLYVCLSMASSPFLYGQEQQNKKVLVLHSYHRGLSWDDAIDRGIASVFEKGNLDVETQIEYMDTKRIHDSTYMKRLYSLFQYKFKNRKFDVIISSDNNAFDFLLKHRDKVFPGTPVVFCGVNNFQDSMLEGQGLYTGTVEDVDLQKTLDTALELHPQTRHIFIYGSGTITYFANEKKLRKIIPDYKNSVEFHFVEGLNIRQVQNHIRRLPDNSLILTISSVRDEQGVTMPFQRASEMMAAASRVPIYSCWDFFLGHGIVGGKLVSGFAQGETAARIALRILTGERIKNIPVIKESPNRYMFDYRQMKRFGIKTAQLPAGSIVINKPYSFYSGHKGLIWSVAASIAGLILIILFLSVNILARKRAEEALSESEKKYRTLFEDSNDAIYLNTLQGEFIDVNQAMLDLFGYTREEMIGMNAIEIYAHPGDRLTSLKEIERKGFHKNYVIKFKKKDGTEMDCVLTATLRRTDDGRIVGYQGIIRDITERLRAEEALKESKKRYKELYDESKRAEEVYRSLLHTSADAIVIYDMEGKARYINSSFTKLFGWTMEEVEGKRIPFVPESEREATMAGIKEVFKGEKALYDFETKRYTKDGHMVDVSLSASRYQDHEGNPAGMLVILRDISERKRLEAQFQAAQRMESLGTLAGGIAHDFNNLLMGIQGNASLMLLDVDSRHSNYEKLMNIQQYVQNGADLTRQLLALARGGKYEVKPTDLNELIKNQNRMFGATKKEIRIREKYEQDLWTAEVDQGQMRQVMMNLFVNAWQAMPGGGDLYIQTENVTLDESYMRPYHVKPGRYVKISVTDTGVGMDEATRQRIFDPFFTTKEMARGTGLGLAAVYGIIKNHGGIIDVYSQKGEGTAFTIYLPASEKEATQEKGSAKDDILKGSGTILLVDDEEMIIDVGKQMIERLGYEVFVARGSKEAIEVYEKNMNKIDMVILDMIMPDMGGGETYDRLKNINPDIKVLLSSGYSINGQARAILDRGCNGFIQKPFNMKSLSQKLKELEDTVS